MAEDKDRIQQAAEALDALGTTPPSTGQADDSHQSQPASHAEAIPPAEPPPDQASAPKPAPAPAAARDYPLEPVVRVVVKTPGKIKKNRPQRQEKKQPPRSPGFRQC